MPAFKDLFNAFQRQGEAPPSAAAADLGDEQYVTAHLSDSDMDEVHSLEEYSFESCDEDLASSSPDVAGCPSRVQPLDSTQREPQGSVSSSAEMSAARWRERHLCDTLRRSQEEAREYRKRAEVAEAHAAELQAEAEAMRSLLSGIRFIPRAYYNNYLRGFEAMGFEWRYGHLGAGYYKISETAGLQPVPLAPVGHILQP